MRTREMEHAERSPPAKPRDPSSAPAAKPLPPGLWAKAKHVVVHNVLHLDDTPHRIAFGVFLGFLVGATPTLGFQMIIYVAIAAIVGANKLSGILPVWMSNPVTAVPLYYSNWRVGQLMLGGEAVDGAAGRDLIASVVGLPGQDLPMWERLTSEAFWTAAMDAFVEMGAELWVGSLAVGLILGGVGYWATYRGVIAFRAHQAKKHEG